MTIQEPVLPTDWEEEPSSPSGHFPSGSAPRSTRLIQSRPFTLGWTEGVAGLAPAMWLRRAAEMLCQESPIVAPAAEVSPFRRVRFRTTALLEKVRPDGRAPFHGSRSQSGGNPTAMVALRTGAEGMAFSL